VARRYSFPHMKAVLREAREQVLSTPAPFVLGVVALIAALVLGWGWWVLGLAILIPTGIAVYQRPQRGILILVALLPFDGIMKALGPGWLNPWKQVLILGLLLLTFLCPPEARAQEKRKFPSWVLPFAVLLVMGLLSAVFVDPNTALIGLRLSYFSALIGLTIWRCPLDRRERDHLVTIFVVMGIVTSVVGLWQQAVGHAYLHDLGYEYDENIRFTSGLQLRSFSTFNLPFSFGFYLMLVFLIGLPMSLAEPRRLRSKIFFLSIPLLSLGLLFSFVRGAMLGLAIGLLYLAFHRYKLLVYGIPFVFVAALFIPSGANVSNAVFSSSSFADRTVSWSQRLDQFADNPIVGTGIGTTGAAAEKAAFENNQDPNATYVPDNSWLKVAFEIGVFGLWLFVIWIIMAFLYTRRAERRVEGIDKDFVAGATAQIVAVMVGALVATYFELTPMDQLFWVMITIVATMAPQALDGSPLVSSPASTPRSTP
jgi:putative inorganic carbon (HCO3(-)) transporter